MGINLEGRKLQGESGNYLPCPVFSWLSVQVDKFIVHSYITTPEWGGVHNSFTGVITKAPKVRVSCPESFRKSVSDQGMNCGTSTHQNATLTYETVLLKDWARAVVVDGKNQDTVMAEGNRVRKIKALQTGSQVSTWYLKELGRTKIATGKKKRK